MKYIHKVKNQTQHVELKILLRKFRKPLRITYVQDNDIKRFKMSFNALKLNENS